MALPAAPYYPNVLNAGIIQRIIDICLYEPAILPPSESDPRYKFSLVCSRWRDLVLSTPEYWTEFSFSPGRFHNPVQQLQIFHAYVGRSGSNPLSFHFNTNFEHHRSTPLDSLELQAQELVYGGGQFSIVRHVIMPYIHRIQHLRCTIYRQENLEFLLNVHRGGFEMLKTVNITFIDDVKAPHSRIIKQQSFNFQVFRSLPNLRQATILLLNGVHPLDLHFQWRQMVKLDFGNTPMSSDVFIRILRQSAPSLADGYFYVELDKCSHQFLMTCSPFEMPELAIFRLRLVNPSFYPDIILLFRLPELKEIWVEQADIYRHYPWDITKYTAMLAHSTASLKRLIFMNFLFAVGTNTQPPTKSRVRRTSHQELDKLFEVTHNLDSLCLPWNIHFHLPTIEKMANGKLLPRLQALDIGTTEADWIFGMVRTRRALSTQSTSKPKPPAAIAVLHLILPDDGVGVRTVP